MDKDRSKSKKSVLNFVLKYAVITLGCVIYSLGVALFLDANNLASGGVTGIAIIISHLIDSERLSTGLLIIIINVPLFILGAIFFGRKFTLSTIFATVLSSLFIELWGFLFSDKIPVAGDNILLSALIGGTLFGLGLGLIFRMGSTTGGTDIIVKILRKKFRYIRTGVISMIIDVTIVCVSALINKNFELTCYTIVAITVFTLVFDWVLYGGNSAKLVYIITTNEKSEAICVKILKELDVGATYVDGEGAYTGKEKRIIMCAIKNFLYPRLRDVVREADPNAFMIVSSAKEIYGEGYKNHTDEEL